MTFGEMFKLSTTYARGTVIFSKWVFEDILKSTIFELNLLEFDKILSIQLLLPIKLKFSAKSFLINVEFDLQSNNAFV